MLGLDTGFRVTSGISKISFHVTQALVKLERFSVSN
jgi:hypothetical protein